MPRITPELLILFAAAFATALVQSFLMPVDCDVSWLITVNEKMLAGQRLYLDVLEVNPPASVWLYTPAVWVAGQLGLHAEAVVVAEFIGGALVSCLATLRLAAHLRPAPRPILLAALLAFSELLLPLGTFAQREHAAILFAAPALAGCALLAERKALPVRWRFAIGVAAGLVVVIKPHFALAMVPGIAWGSWRARSLKPFVPICAAAATIVGAYATAILIFTPAYLQLVPMLTEIYLPLHEHWPILLRGPVVIVPVALFALSWMLRPNRIPALAAMFLLASAGFAVAGVVQAKGYLNHALPGMALGFVGFGLLAGEPGLDARRRSLAIGAAAVLACFELYAMASIRPIAGLAEAVKEVAPPHPTVITLGPELLTGHPLVRNVGGEWVGSRPALFIAVAAHGRLSRRNGAADPRLRAWFEADLDSFAHDVRRAAPDVILVDSRPELGWLSQEPQVRRAMAGYESRAHAEDVEVWVRKGAAGG